MSSKRVLFITQEIMPYVDESPLALLGRKQPQYVQDHTREIRVFMPKWGTINERRSQLHEVQRLSGMNLIIDDTDHLLIIKVASIPSARIPVYFIDNDDFFMRRLEVTDEQGEEYPDNAERAIFYCRGVLETVKKMRWVPDVVHCQGWMSVVAPIYIKRSYCEEPSYRDSRVVFTPSAMDTLKLSTTDQFRADILFKNITSEDLNDYPQHLTLRDLNHLAIDYSDGLLLTEESNDPELVEYAQSKGVPVLGPVDMNTDGAERILEFYEKVEKIK